MPGRLATRVSDGTPLGLRLRGGNLAVLVVIAEPWRKRMCIELHGPGEILDRVTAVLHGDIWAVTTWGPVRSAEPVSGPCTAVAWVPEGTELDAELAGGELITWGAVTRVAH